MAEMRMRGTLDTRNYERGVKKMQGENQKFGGGLGKVKGMIAKAFAVTAVIALVRAIGRAISSVVSLGSELNDLSRQTGVNIETLQKYTAAVEDGGGKQANLVNGFNRVRDAQGEVAKGDKVMTEAINALGITTEEFLSLNTDQAFLRISKAITEAGNSAGAMNAAGDILGKRNLPNLINGMNALSESTETAAGNILTLSTESAAGLDALGNKFRRLGQNIKTGFAEIVGGLAAKVFGANVEKAAEQSRKLEEIDDRIRAKAVKDIKAKREEERLKKLQEIAAKEDEIRSKQAEEIGKIERSVKLEISTDSMRKIGGFAGGMESPQLQIARQQATIMRKLEEYNKSLPQIEKNTRGGGGLA